MSDPPLRRGWLLSAYAALFLLGLFENVRGPILPELLRDLRLNDTQGGLLFAIASAGVVAGSLVGRRAVARVGAVRWQLASVLICGAGTGLTALAADLTALLLGAALFGLGGGGLMVTQNLLVSRGTPPDLRRQALSGLHAMYGLASLLAPLWVTLLAQADLGWRASLGLLVVPAVLLAGAHLSIAPDPVAADAGPQGKVGWRGQQVALIAGLYVTSELLVSTRLVLFLRREGITPEAASLGLTGFFACLLAGRVLFSVWRWPASNRSLLALCAAGSLACNAGGLWVSPWLFVPAGFCMAPFFPAVMDLVSEEFPHAIEPVLGRTFATVSTLLVAAHWGVGALSDRFDLRSALAVGPAGLVLLLVLLALLPRPAQSD